MYAFTGLLIQATPFGARVVRGTPLMCRHQLQQVAALSEGSGLAPEVRGGPATGAAAAGSIVIGSSSSSNSRRAQGSAGTGCGFSSNGRGTRPDSNFSLHHFLHAPLTLSLPKDSSPASSASDYAQEGLRKGSALATSFAGLARAFNDNPPHAASKNRTRASLEDEEPVPWQSVDIFAWSLMDENGEYW